MSCPALSSNGNPVRTQACSRAHSRGLLLLAAVLLAACHPPAAQREEGPQVDALDAAGRAFFVSLPIRPEARQPFLLLLPAEPRAVAVLLPGGDGAIGLDARGGVRDAEGMLVAGRERLVQAGLAVALLAPPSDRDSLRGYRTDPAHAQDVGAAIAWLRRRLERPVWLVGSSRGTISAASAAARLAGEQAPDGLVLASPITVESEGESVYSAPLAAIHVPTLVVAHRLDACPVTPFGGAAPLLQALSGAATRALIPIEGGGPPAGLPCTATHYHGFAGAQAETLRVIAAWILAHGPRGGA